MASFGGEPGQALSGRNYTNPQGVKVHQFRLSLSAVQAGTLGLILHTGAADSLDIKLMVVDDMRMLATSNRRISAKDLLVLGPRITEPVDCGSAAPCHPTRIIVDLRLAASPQAHLWVCQITLEDGQ